MSDVDEPRRSLTLTEFRDDAGYTRRTIHLLIDRRLVIEGHDLGDTEYEFERTLSVAATAQLAGLLDVPVDGLLPAIQQRFGTTQPLEAFLEEHDVPTEFWNRIGD